MRKKIDYIFVFIIALLGIVHISLTPAFYETFNDEANIFIGMGLAFVFLGVINLNRLAANQRNITVFCLICNLLAISYLTFYSIMLNKIEPQALVTIFVILVPTVISVLSLIKKQL